MKPRTPAPPNLSRVQNIRKMALLLCLVAGIGVISVAHSAWESGSLAHEWIEWFGVALIVFCIIGRTWSTLYIGGKKTRELVQHGPYSMSRNPLYLFTFLGAAGMGAQLGSLTLALVTAFIAWAVFSIVVMKEEQALRAKFGKPYRTYLQRVPRFFPKFSLFRDLETVEVRPKLVRRTFVDACIFLLSMPVAESFEYLQDHGILPILYRLP